MCSLVKAVTANKWLLYIHQLALKHQVHLSIIGLKMQLENRECGCERRNPPPCLRAAWLCSGHSQSLPLPGCAREATTGPGLGFCPCPWLTIFLLWGKYFFFFFSLTYLSKPRSIGNEKQVSSSVMHNAARRTYQGIWGGREGISCLPLITVRKWTHSGDLIYFQSYWQSFNWNDGMKSNCRWVMKGQ